MKVGKLLKVLVVASAVIGATSAMAGIANSKHDLSAGSGTTGITKADTEDQLCVFCHTPHAASAAYASAPLWNKSEVGGTTYTLYGLTVANTNNDLDTAGVPNDPSKVCLSCHDGINAINSVVNAPGSGMGTTGYVDMNTTVGEVAYAMPAGVTQIGDTNGTNVDLSNDHPVSMLYMESAAASLRPKNTDLYMTTGTDINWTVGGFQVTAAGDKFISDLLRSNRIECVSCHDPHLGSNPTFLRVSNNSQSKLCTTCHDK